MNNLTEKQKLFGREYIKDLNQTQAAIRAGYSERTAKVKGSTLLAKINLKEYINVLMEERKERLEIDADFVLNNAVEVFNRCMQNIRPKTNMKGEVQTDEDGNALFVFDANNSLKALDLIGRHIKVNAFNNKIELSTPENKGLTINVTNKEAKNNLEELADKLK